MQQYKGDLYIAAQKSDGPVLYQVNMEGENISSILLELEENARVENFLFCADETIAALVIQRSKTASEGKSELRYVLFTKKGKLIKSVVLEMQNKYSAQDIRSTFFQEDESAGILAGQTFFLYDKDGKLLGNMDMSTYVETATVDRKGKIYAFSPDGNGGGSVKQLDILQKKKQEEYTIPLSIASSKVLCTAALQAGRYDFFLTDGKGLYGYSIQKETAVQLLEWIDKDIDATRIQRILCISEDSYAVLLNGGQKNEQIRLLYISELTKGEKEKDYREIVLSCFSLEEDVKRMIINWNQSQEDYRIIIRDYSEYEEPEMQMALDIVSGKAADIYYGKDFSMLDRYVKKGLFADFYDLMAEDDDGIQKEELLESVCRLYEVDGGLYYLPWFFSVSGYTGSRDILGGRERWTLQEAEKLMKDGKDGTQLFYNTTKKSFLITAFSRNFSELYNSEEGLNREYFSEILKFTDYFPEKEDTDDRQDREECYRTGEILLYGYSLTGGSGLVRTIHTLCSIYGKDGYGFIGYPCMEGSGISVYSQTPVLAITADSQVKNAAWSFVQLFYSYEVQNHWYDFSRHLQLGYDGFPVNIEAFDKMFEKVTAEEDYEDEYGDLITGNKEPLSEKEVEFIKDCVMRADRTADETTDSMTIKGIVLEEAESYFQGDRTLEETVEIITNRCHVYAGEQK